VIAVSIGSAAITYEVVSCISGMGLEIIKTRLTQAFPLQLGIIGYLTFGQGVSSNVISMYPWTSIIIAIGRLGIVLLVALSYPLQAHPCRACLHTLTSGLRKKDGQSPDESIVADEDTDEEDGLMDKDDHGLPVGKPMGRKKFVALTTGIIICGFAIAMVIDELETGELRLRDRATRGGRAFADSTSSPPSVLSFVGSTGSTIISFILPGMFYFSLFRHEQGVTKWMALTLAVYGIIVMTFW